MLRKETIAFSLTPTIKGSQLDNYTEAIYLNEALINMKSAGLIDCILSGYVFTPSESFDNTLETLSKVIAEPETGILSDSSKRFFNGYEIIVKPLLILTDYSGIRQINMFLTLFLSLLMFQLMIRRRLERYIPAVIISLLFIRPLTIALNMTFFGFYVCMLVPCIFILFSKEETLQQRGWLLFGITGAVTYYFNMNYFQLLSFGIPLLFYFLITGTPRKSFDLLKTIAYFFFTWLVGCVGMMVFKWIAYAVLVDLDIFSQMMDTFLFRTDVDRGSRWQAITINLETAFGSTWWNILEILFMAGNIFGWIKNKKMFALSRTNIVLLAVMILIPVGRYFILANHVIIHHWVMYRLLMIPVLTFNILITKMWSENGPKKGEGIHI